MSWYLDTDNRLNHANLAKEGESGFVYPYPYMFWDYISDTNKTLTLNHGEFKPMRYAIVNEEENRNDNQTLTFPYPATMWYLDEENKLMNVLLPNEPRIPSVYAGDVRVKNIYIGDQLVQAQYIGKIPLQLDK